MSHVWTHTLKTFCELWHQSRDVTGECRMVQCRDRCLLDMLASNGFQQLSSQLSKEVFLAHFCQQFEELLHVLAVDGFLHLRDKYTSMWMHTGQMVQASLRCVLSCLMHIRAL